MLQRGKLKQSTHSSSATPLRTICADYLLSHFGLKTETARWMLLERKK